MSSLFFTLLNAFALLGWSAVLLITLARSVDSELWLYVEAASHIRPLLLGLEAVCLVEVTRIALGMLRGNLVLGTVLHAIRLTCLSYVLGDDAISVAVLFSWSLTEVTR